MDTDANELRAIKAIRRPAAILANAAPRTALELARDSKRAQLQREIAIMKKCRHRNIVSLYEVIDDPSLDVMYLVMQYVDKGPIATIRNDGTIEKRIEAGALADYALQIVKGLRYLHRSGIIHRDMPDNILLGSKGDVYLADFGVTDARCCAFTLPGLLLGPRVAQIRHYVAHGAFAPVHGSRARTVNSR